MWLLCQSSTVCNVLPLPLPPPRLLHTPFLSTLFLASWLSHSHILPSLLCFMLPQPTVYLYLFPSLCTSLLLFFFHFSPRLRGWSPWGGAGKGLAGEWRCIWLVLENVLLCSSMARAFEAQQMFQIHAYIAADPCTLMNYSLCFHWAAEHETGWEEMGRKRSKLRRKEAGTVIWGTGVSLLIILVHSLNLPEQLALERRSAIAVWTYGCTYLLKFSSLPVYACNVCITALWYTCYCGCRCAMSLWHCSEDRK